MNMRRVREHTDVSPSEQDIDLSERLAENVEFFDRALGIGVSFDIIKRDLSFAGHDFVMIFINGFINDTAVDDVMRRLSMLRREDLIRTDVVEKVMETFGTHTQLEKVAKAKDVLTAILSGQTALLIDGYAEAVLIDARKYPARSPQEPELERVVRGSRDGFVETLVQNTVLTRRRIRDPRLRMENMKVGARSKTDICVAYLQDVADPELVAEIKKRLREIDVDGLPMAEKTVEEWITKRNQWNPYPVVRYTERPDVAAVHLLEGHVLIYVDTSPSVMITPATFFHHLQHAEEYRENPAVGLYIRLIRMGGVLVSLFLMPLWILFTLIHRDWLPAELAFLGPESVGALPIILQFLLADLGIDFMRMAAIHTPGPLATAMGLIAAVLIGDIAVKVGMFAPETILYLAVAAIGMFATPSYELSMANRLARTMFILAVGLFDWYGLTAAVVLWTVLLVTARSINRPYLWPLFPLNLKALASVLLRAPVRLNNHRPAIVHPQDKDRQPH